MRTMKSPARRRRFGRSMIAWGAAAAALSAGCGAGTGRGAPSTAETVTMEPVRVRAQASPDGEIEVDAYDAQDLLRRGNESLEAGECPAALDAYDRLISEFAGSSLVSAAQYNAALCLERTGRLDQAVERYLAVVEGGTSSDALDALFQAARARERQERWRDAVVILDQALERGDLGPDERLEAMTRRGAALVRSGEPTEGERQLRRAIAFYRRQGGERFRTDYFLAQAQYSLGEIPREAISGVELSNEERRFRIGLEERCGLLLRAQTQYVQAIRVGNAHWAAASAYRIGEMYSSLYEEIMELPVPEAEVPQDITEPDEVRIFREEYPRHYRRILREYLEPLLHNAIRWWESNLMMMERTGVRGHWAEQTRDDLQRIQNLLDRITMEEGAEDDETPEDNGGSGG